MNVSRPQPEEIESYIHERSWDQIKGLDWLYGAWVWQMFDAASEVREEGDTIDVNTKGLVSFDRKVKKDAFYFYKAARSEEHTSELQSLMRISYAVFCLKKKKT